MREIIEITINIPDIIIFYICFLFSVEFIKIGTNLYKKYWKKKIEKFLNSSTTIKDLESAFDAGTHWKELYSKKNKEGFTTPDFIKFFKNEILKEK